MKLDIACTIASASYIPFARVLAESFKRHHPESSFYVVLIDEAPAEVDLGSEHYRLIPLKELEIPQLGSLLFKYDVTEASTAVKPFVLTHLLNLHRGARVAYIDPDIFMFKEMQEVSVALDVSDIVLVPHILSPYDDSYIPSEMDFLKIGAYNLGFIAMRDSNNVRGFLSWWGHRLVAECYTTPGAGIFTDQKWVDLVPSFLEKVCILRDPSYNVAYWNLHERRISRENHGYVVNNDADLVLYHFSGLDVRNPHALSKYQNRFDLSSRPDIQPLVEMYVSAVRAAGFDKLHRVPYAFDYYSNSIKIGQFARRLYGALGQEADRFGDPFAVDGNNSFYSLLRRRTLLEYTKPDQRQNSSGERSTPRNRLVQEFLIQTFFRLLRRALGVRRYARLLPFLSKMCLDRNQAFLLDNWSPRVLRDGRK